MRRRPPRSTRTYTLVPYTSLLVSGAVGQVQYQVNPANTRRLGVQRGSAIEHSGKAGQAGVGHPGQLAPIRQKTNLFQYARDFCDSQYVVQAQDKADLGIQRCAQLIELDGTGQYLGR